MLNITTKCHTWTVFVSVITINRLWILDYETGFTTRRICVWKEWRMFTQIRFFVIFGDQNWNKIEIFFYKNGTSRNRQRKCNKILKNQQNRLVCCGLYLVYITIRTGMLFNCQLPVGDHLIDPKKKFFCLKFQNLKIGRKRIVFFSYFFFLEAINAIHVALHSNPHGS